jgi:RimJ/RimL family protein N-acetyltransferase
MSLLRTDRLLLRPWRDDDLSPFAVMCADARVMQHFPALLSCAESDAAAGRIREHWTEHRFGLWAIELPGVAPFIGFVGLMRPSFEAHFTPCVEVGWRLAPEHWGRGYATEGARAALSFGWETLRLDEIVSMTVIANARSWRVMDRLGMKRDPADDFDHPRVPEGHAMRRHILYRIRHGFAQAPVLDDVGRGVP